MHATCRPHRRRSCSTRSARSLRSSRRLRCSASSSRGGSDSRCPRSRPRARSGPRSPTTGPISTRAATTPAWPALRRRCAGVLRAELPAAGLELELDPLVDALLASLRFTAFADVRPALIAARVARSAARGGEQLGRVAARRLARARARAAARRDPHLGGGRRAQAGAGDLRAGACARRRASPDQAIHVGDSLEEDVAGARAAGIEPVLVRRGRRTAGARRADDLELWPSSAGARRSRTGPALS